MYSKLLAGSLLIRVPLLFVTVTDEDTVKRYYAKFEEMFFQTCEKELAKINTFYSGTDSFETPIIGRFNTLFVQPHLNEFCWG